MHACMQHTHTHLNWSTVQCVTHANTHRVGLWTGVKVLPCADRGAMTNEMVISTCQAPKRLWPTDILLQVPSLWRTDTNSGLGSGGGSGGLHVNLTETSDLGAFLRHVAVVFPCSCSAPAPVCERVCVWEYVCRAPNSSVSVALSKSYTPFARSCHSGSVVCRSCGCSNARSRHWYSEGLQKKRLCVWSPLKPFPLAHRQSRAPCDMGRQIARTQARIHRALECNVPHAHKEWEGMGALLCPTSDCGFGRVRGGVCSICCHWKSIRSILHHCKCMCVCVFVCVCLWT